MHTYNSVHIARRTLVLGILKNKTNNSFKYCMFKITLYIVSTYNKQKGLLSLFVEGQLCKFARFNLERVISHFLTVFLSTLH